MSKRNFALLSVASSVAGLVFLASARPVQAQHEVQASLSQKGLDFIAHELPDYLPTHFQVPTFSKSVSCLDFQQRNTSLNIRMDDIKISVPREGSIQIDIDFSGDGAGELFIDNFYACFGTLTCSDTLTVSSGRASFEYTIGGRNGNAVVAPVGSRFHFDPSNINFNLSDCGMTGEALNSGIAFSEEWILQIFEEKLSSIADEYLAANLGDMLDGFQMNGDLGFTKYSASLTGVELRDQGLFMRMLADVGDNFAPATCVAQYDKGGPVDFEGPQPQLSAPDENHANLAINLGLINKGLYAIWRRGLMCLTDEHIRSLGVELDLSAVGALLPGFPAGTKFSFDITMTDYPRVIPSASKDSKVSVRVEGLVLNLHGDRPDGTRNTLHVELDMNASATVGINPATNAIYATLDGARVTRMVLEDERKATGEGFDVPRILQMLHNHILPGLLEKMGPLPLTGPAFSFEGYTVILRELQTSNAFVKAGINLFKIPSDDTTAPETQIVEYPLGPINPQSAIVRVSGLDSEIPSELLQFQLTVDGEVQDPSFMRAFHIGVAGETATYKVEVAAIDLSENIDASPAMIEVTVDGIVPHVSIIGTRVRRADVGPVALSWSLSDDLSAPAEMNVIAKIFVLDDPSDALSARLIDTQELGLGATDTSVELEQVGGIYRVEIHVTDEAGNDSVSSLLLTIPSSGGCSVGGGRGAGNLVLLLLALGGVFLRRRQKAGLVLS